VDFGKGKLIIDAKEAFVRLGGVEGASDAVLAVFWWVRMGAVTPSLADVCLPLDERTTLEGRHVIVCDTDLRCTS